MKLKKTILGVWTLSFLAMLVACNTDQPISSFPSSIFGSSSSSSDSSWSSSWGSSSSSSMEALSIEILEGDSLTLDEGDEKKLHARVNREDAIIEWASENVEVATVSSDGIVTALQEGETMIHVTARDGEETAYAMVRILVLSSFVPLGGVELNVNELTLDLDDDPYALSVNLYPEDTSVTPDQLTWQSSNEFVATVDKNGVVTPKGYGEGCDIRVLYNGEVLAVCTVKVQDSEAKLLFAKQEDGTYFVFSTENPDIQEVTVPSAYNGKPVTGVSMYAFSGLKSLTSIHLPETIARIDDSAFSGCSSLKEITLPSSVTSIGRFLFSDCTALENVALPAQIDTIPDYCFSDCASLRRISIPSSVKSIGSYAFSGCTNLQEAVLPSQLETIGEYAFQMCESLPQIAIPSSVTYVGTSAFLLCGNLVIYLLGTDESWSNLWNASLCPTVRYDDVAGSLDIDGIRYLLSEEEGVLTATVFRYLGSQTEVVIPDTITSEGREIPVVQVGDYAFYGCDTLQSVSFGSNLSHIGVGAFLGCSGLRDVSFSEGLRTIGNDAFSGCTSLELLSLPEGLEEIGQMAFDGCSALRYVYIPSSTEIIGWHAFRDCPALTIYTAFNYAPTGWDGTVRELTVIWSYGTGSFFRVGDFVYFLLDDQNGIAEVVSYVGEEANVTVPETLLYEGKTVRVTSIGMNAFENANIAHVVLPQGLEEIGAYAFRGCSNLQSVNLPDSLVSIGGAAFSGCTSLASVIIPSTIEFLGNILFEYDSNTILYCEAKESSENWENQWFGNAKVVYDYKNVQVYEQNNILYSIPNDMSGNAGVICIGPRPSVSGVVILPGTIAYGGRDLPIVKIEDGAFCGDDIEEILLPNVVKEIGRCAFAYCKNLKVVELPESLLSIGFFAFYGCTLLEAVSIPGSVEYTGSNAIDYHTRVYLPFDEIPLEWEENWHSGSPQSETEAFKSVFRYQDYFVGIHEDSDEELSAELVSYSGPDGDIKIPTEIPYFGKSVPVTILGRQLFSERQITSVEIPDTVEILEAYAFGYTGLTAVDLPSSLTSIGAGCFSNTALKKIVLPDGIKTIENSTFSQCTDLQEVVFSKSLETIEGYAFYGCSSLGHVILPDGLLTIGESAFMECQLSYAYVPETVLTIGVHAFDDARLVLLEGERSRYFSGNPLNYAENVVRGDFVVVGDFLYNIYERDGILVADILDYYGAESDLVLSETIRYGEKEAKVISIGEWVFYDNQDLKSITMPDTIEKISAFAFSGSSVEKIRFSRILLEIGDKAFAECRNIVSLYLPDGLERIGDSAFYNCASLQLIFLPESVTSLGSDNFNSMNLCRLYTDGSISLVDVTLLTTGVQVIDFVEVGCLFYAIIQGEDGQLYAETALYMGQEIQVTIPESVIYGGEAITVKGIGKGAFIGGTNIDRVDMADSIEYIRDYAFESCESLYTVIFSASLKTIGTYAFAYCYALTSVYFPDSLREIGRRAFDSCYDLKEVRFNEGLLSIGDTAFFQCPIDYVLLPQGIEFIGQSAFNEVGYVYIREESKPEGWEWDPLGNAVWNPNLEEIVIENGFHFGIYYEDGKPYAILYHYDGDAGYLSLPGQVACDSAFDAALVEIYQSVFESCNTLLQVSIPDSVTVIGKHAFGYCTQLNFVKLPKNLTEIPAGCFSNCPELTNISFPEGLQAIGQDAFSGCVKLSDLRLPSTLTSIGGYAFLGCSSLTSLILPNGLLTIGEYAFYSTDMLYVFIPESVANIGSGALSSRYLFCEAASKPEGWALVFYYGDAYTRYGTPHFDEFLFVDDVDILYGIRTNEEGLLEAEILAYFGEGTSITLSGTVETDSGEATVTSIGDHAFNSTSITEIVIPDTVLTIGYAAFANCFYLLRVDMGKGVKTIGGSAFLDCLSLNTMIFSTSLETIGEYAFSGCSSLPKYLILPDSLVSIGGYAFYSCDQLMAVFLSENVEQIGEAAFNPSDPVLFLSASESDAPAGAYYQTVFDFNPIAIFEKDGFLYAVLENLNGLEYAQIIRYLADDEEILVLPETVEYEGKTLGVYSIGEFAFYDCYSLRHVVCSSSISEIRDYAFYNCSSLSSIDLGSVQTIGNYVFEATQIRAIVIPKTVQTTITNDIIPNNVRIYFQGEGNIGSYSNCDFLFAYQDGDYIYLVREEDDGSLVAYIEKYLGEETNPTLPESFTYLGQEVSVIGIFENGFSGNSTIERIVIPDAYVFIGHGAFSSCLALEEIVIPASVETIESQAFSNDNVKIYCEAESKPEGWDDEWYLTIDPDTIEWGYVPPSE